jgi:hypothetical protein
MLPDLKTRCVPRDTTVSLVSRLPALLANTKIRLVSLLANLALLGTDVMDSLLLDKELILLFPVATMPTALLISQTRYLALMESTQATNLLLH